MVKKGFLLLFLFVALKCTKKDVFNVPAQIIINPISKCENGLAGNYPCNDYDLLAFIPLDEMSGLNTSGNDCWGWVDPETNKEYALMATNKGVTFIDISDPANTVILGTLKTRTVNSSWRDVKVFNSFAYVVSEATDHGVQIFNLTKLKDVSNPPVEFNSDSDFTLVKSAHNIFINNDSGFAYVVGSPDYQGGPIFLDINSPFVASVAGNYSAGGYSHDVQVVTYNGPDTDYTGKEILIGSNENEVAIIDVTDKRRPIKISTISYPNIGYTHQGWFTEDFKYFLLGDELDERDFGTNTRTVIFDFTDLDNPVHHMDYLGPTAAIDHNGYVKDNIFYQANYTGGVRMIDISDIENKNLREVGYFDTYPENNNTSSNGAWNVYPFFPSGNIIISDINRGLFVIRKKGS